MVVYASQDQVYAEPILKQFEKETGIRVRAIYDSEAVKTVGLANRLLAEKNNPQCDVFWNNEELRTRQLAAKQVVKTWAAVGHRSRRIVINTNLVQRAPASLVELTNAEWKGKVALAYPLFGTTATHFLILRQRWGLEWEQWCRALRANNPFLVDGNSVVVRFVARGEAAVGLTDSDDIAAWQDQSMPIMALPVSPQTALFIPNTIALIQNAPHLPEAQKLCSYLASPEVLQALVKAGALESTESRGNVGINWEALLGELEPATTKLKEIFLR